MAYGLLEVLEVLENLEDLEDLEDLESKSLKPLAMSHKRRRRRLQSPLQHAFALNIDNEGVVFGEPVDWDGFALPDDFGRLGGKTCYQHIRRFGGP